MAQQRRACGAVRVDGPAPGDDTEPGQRRPAGAPPVVEDTSEDAYVLPGVGPVTTDNPRALAAGVGGALLFAALTR